jgi:hypothetical protein
MDTDARRIPLSLVDRQQRVQQTAAAAGNRFMRRAAGSQLAGDRGDRDDDSRKAT